MLFALGERRWARGCWRGRSSRREWIWIAAGRSCIGRSIRDMISLIDHAIRLTINHLPCWLYVCKELAFPHGWLSRRPHEMFSRVVMRHVVGTTAAEWLPHTRSALLHFICINSNIHDSTEVHNINEKLISFLSCYQFYSLTVAQCPRHSAMSPCLSPQHALNRVGARRSFSPFFRPDGTQKRPRSWKGTLVGSGVRRALHGLNLARK